MKKRQLEKFIKDDVRKATPDVLERIDFDAIDIEEKQHAFRWRRLFKPVMVPAMALSVLALLILAVVNLSDGFIPGNGNGPGNGTIVYAQKEEAYTLSAISAVTLLNQVELEGNNLYQGVNLLNMLSFNDSGSAILLDDHLDQLHRNLNMIEPLIGDKNHMGFSLSESELEAYAYKMVFTSTDMRGRTVDYTMHYNETEEDEDTYLLEGIMIIRGITYHLEGEIEFDGDDFELELIATHPDDEDTYVEINQEITSDEHTLTYKVVRNGDTIYESELSIEYDGDIITIEIEYESDTLEITFEIERRTINNRHVYHIEYDIEDHDRDEDGEIIVEIIYDESEDSYYYRYSIETDEEQVIRYKRRTALTD